MWKSFLDKHVFYNNCDIKIICFCLLWIKWRINKKWNYLLFGLPTLCKTRSVLPNGLLSPQLPPHLQVAGAHDQEGDAIGQNKVSKIVAETMKESIIVIKMLSKYFLLLDVNFYCFFNFWKYFLILTGNQFLSIPVCHQTRQQYKQLMMSC